MVADPEPNEVIARLDRERAIRDSDTSRPEAAHFLEVERGILRVLLQASKRLVCKLADVGW